MAMSNARLKKLCGALPQVNIPCPFEGCTRVVGPYYYSANARAALMFHVSAIHGYTREEPEEEKPVKPPRPGLPRTAGVRKPRGTAHVYRKF